MKIYSHYSLSFKYFLKIFLKIYESFKNLSISHIDSQNQFSNQVILSQIQSTISALMIESTTQISINIQNQSLKNIFTNFKIEYFTHINI